MTERESVTASDRWESVARIEEIDGGPKQVDVDGKSFLLHENDGGVRAYRNVCPHQLGPVAEGHVDEETGCVICPWHGWEFDLESGRNPYEPELGSLPEARTTVEDGQVFLQP